MIDIDALAARVKAGLDADEQGARAVGCSKIYAVNFLMKSKWLVLCDERGESPTEALPAELADHIVRQQPAAILARVARDRRLLDLLLAEKHDVHDDQYYTCPAATQDRDGGTYAETNGGGHCNCGRDERVGAYLTVLAGEDERGGPQ